MTSPAPLGVLIVAENISLRMSGETILPYHYLTRLRDEGMRTRALCHARVRDELRADLPAPLFDSIDFVEDTWLQSVVHRVGQLFPHRIHDLIFNQLIHILTQMQIRRVIAGIIVAHSIDVALEPAPIAPKALSFLFNLGIPVVIGPMSGGMEFPPAFAGMDSLFVQLAIGVGRRCAGMLHHLVPGKLLADVLIVGNKRTRRALPKGARGEIIEVMESGVDFESWDAKSYDVPPADTVRFVFSSRFVDWKGIKYLVEAFTPLAREGGVHLDLVGNGELFDDIAAQVEREGIGASVTLHGHVPFERHLEVLRAADVYVTPSLRECGGMAMLEAMSIGLPVVGVRWGGGAQYASDACALLVDPASEATLVEGLTTAMRQLARSPEQRRRLGEAGRQRIIDADLGWASKVARIGVILTDTVARARAARAPAARHDVADAEHWVPQ